MYKKCEKLPSGLYRRGKEKIIHIDKVIRGYRICESCGTSDKKEAEEYLAKKIMEIRNASIYGVRPSRTFRQAAIHFMETSNHKTLKDDVLNIKKVELFIGDIFLHQLGANSLQPFVDFCLNKGLKTGTINHGIEIVNRICKKANTEWIDEFGMTWLASPVHVKLLRRVDKSPPRPMSWSEQETLFPLLPNHLLEMSLYAVNTGIRDSQVCNLQWDWERFIPEINSSVFIIPPEYNKNKRERLVVHNTIASGVIKRQRGNHDEFVFVYRGNPINRMNNTGWKNARKSCRLTHVRVHDLKHTYGRRLRAAGVSYEDRQDLLGHYSGRITTHYSSAEIKNLIEMSNRVCKPGNSTPTLTVIKSNATQISRNNILVELDKTVSC